MDGGARLVARAALAAAAAISALAPPALAAFPGRPLLMLLGANDGDRFGAAIAGRGDFDRDGWPDVVVGAPGFPGGAGTGRVYLYRGGPGMDGLADMNFAAAASQSAFGQAVAWAGDMNGDGAPDLAIGSPRERTSGPSGGAVRIYFGGSAPDTVPDLVLWSPHAGQLFGAAVAAAGDLNGDGFADLVVGAPTDSNVSNIGHAYVYLGGAQPDNVSDLELSGVTAGGAFGSAVGGAGDWNGDGFDDLIVGEPYASAGLAQAGRVRVYFGGPSMDAVPDRTWTGYTSGGRVGHAVGGAGDVNGDGYDDVIECEYGNGLTRLFLGGATPDLLGDQAYYGGNAAAGGGDFNLDGRADVLVTDPTTALLYLGGASPDPNADFTYRPPEYDRTVEMPVAAAGDLDGDGGGEFLLGLPGRVPSANPAGRVYAVTLDPVRLQIVQPNGGELLFAGDSLFVSWIGQDTTDVAISFDAGAAWRTLRTALPPSTASITVAVPDTVSAAALMRVGNTGRPPGGDNSDMSDSTFQIAAYRLLAPQGGETWYVDEADTVRWSGALSADVSISADDGRSWTTLARNAGGGRVNSQPVLVPGLIGDSVRVRVSAAGLPLSSLSWATSDGRLHVLRFQLVSPNGGEVWEAGQPATIRWRGSSPADLALSFDDGATWATVATGVGGAHENAAVVTAPSTGSRAARARVSASGLPLSPGSYDVSDGRFFVFQPVPRSPLPMRAVISPFLSTPGAQLGAAVAPAGDFNGDGYADIIVGAPSYDTPGISDVGRAYVFFGGPGADDRPDVVFAVSASFAHLGQAVAPAGDFNADGFDDVIVGAPDYGANSQARYGQVFVYFGGEEPDSIADLKIGGTGTRYKVGTSVACAGDVNGDGYDDLVIGNQVASPDVPSVQVYFGGPAADANSDWTLLGPVLDANFGAAVAGAGDVNGDGFGDVVVGRPATSANSPGSIHVFFGGPNRDSYPDMSAYGIQGDRFGFSVARAGDVNGDGYDDMVVGAPFNDAAAADAGAAFLFLGGPIPDSSPAATFTGSAIGDEFGTSVASAGDLNADGFMDLLIGAYRGERVGPGPIDTGRAYVFYGRPVAVTTADLVLGGAHASDFFGLSVSPAGDFDADGLPDLLIGADRSDTGGSNAGQAYVYAIDRHELLAPVGGETWIVCESDTIRWRGVRLADLALSTDGGTSWATLATGVGGAAENALAVTAPCTPSVSARVRVSLSGELPYRITSDVSDDLRIALPVPQGVAVAPALRAAAGGFPGEGVGLALAAAGDVNGDGATDFLLGSRRGPAPGAKPDRVRVLFGGRAPPPSLALEIPPGAPAPGLAIAGAGDVNHDGFADVVVGSPGDGARGAEAGRAFVYFGGASADGLPDLVLDGTSAGDHFGAAVAGAGDVNGDGFDDLLVGAPGADASGADAGRVSVYFGAAAPDATAAAALSGAKAGDRFGAAVAGAGHVNGDRFADFAIGAPGNDAAGAESGRAYLFLGAAGSPTPGVTLTGERAFDGFGSAIAAAGDVNGDGFDDVLVGAPFNDTAGAEAGRAYLFQGGPRPDAAADLTLSGAHAGEFFGLALAGAIDINRDGFDDLAVGAPFAAAPAPDAGRVTVYLGGLRPDARADFTWSGRGAGDRFGAALAGAGDLNRDGCEDFLVGAPEADGEVPGAGAAWLYDGRRYVLLEPRGGERWEVGASPRVRWLGAEPADLWLSADGGASWRLLAHAVGGADSNAVAIRVPRPAGDSARVRLAPANPAVPGEVASDSLFSIRAGVALHYFIVTPGPGRVTLAWDTEPSVGDAGLAGYRLYRVSPGGPVEHIGPEMIAATRFERPEPERGATYVLVAINGLGEESELGRVSLASVRPGIAARPVPAFAHEPLTLTLAMPTDAAGMTPADLRVAVYDLMGRRVADLPGGRLATEIGVLTWRWDPRGGRGEPLPSGVYLVRASAPSVGFRDETRIAIVR